MNPQIFEVVPCVLEMLRASSIDLMPVLIPMIFCLICLIIPTAVCMPAACREEYKPSYAHRSPVHDDRKRAMAAPKLSLAAPKLSLVHQLLYLCIMLSIRISALRMIAATMISPDNNGNLFAIQYKFQVNNNWVIVNDA